MSVFDRKLFDRFCRELSVETKESGIIKLGSSLLGTQTYVLDEISKGLADDVHH